MSGAAFSFTNGPFADVLEYALNAVTPGTPPAHDKFTECAASEVTPVPVKEMSVGEFAALLLTVTRPVEVPLADGSNVDIRVVDSPGAKVVPLEPEALKPATATST